MKTKIIIVASILFVILLTNHYKKRQSISIEIQEPIIVQVDVNKMSIPALIDYLAPENASDLKKIAYCESRYNPEAVGDSGKAVNILQFHQQTFNRYANQIGEKLDYHSAYDQIKVADYMLEKGLESQWTCSKLVGVI